MSKVNGNKSGTGQKVSGLVVEALERREMFASSYVAPPPPTSDGTLTALLQPAKNAAGAVDYYLPGTNTLQSVDPSDPSGAVDFYLPKENTAAGAVDFYLPKENTAAGAVDAFLPATDQPPPSS